MLNRWRGWARAVKRDTLTIWLAARHPRTPWYARLLAVLVVGYAFSPIDLVPDFIPVLGYLDDLLLVPLGLVLVIRLLPLDVLADCRQRAVELGQQDRQKNWFAATVIVLLWLTLLAWAVRFGLDLVG